MIRVVCPVCSADQSSRKIVRDGADWVEWYCEVHGSLWFCPSSKWEATRPYMYSSSTAEPIVRIEVPAPRSEK